MIAELVDRILSDMPLLGFVVPVNLFTVGLFAGMKINPALGLSILVAAFVVDCVMSNWIVAHYNLAMDRFPLTVEAAAYGVISLGWIIGGVIRAVCGAICRVKRSTVES
jgi:hypothetical protein